MEREYVVVVNRGVDLAAFDAEMAASQGHGAIPGRSVDVADPRLGSRRMTHWMITDAEAEQLRLDPRVLSVEIPVDQRTDVQIGKTALQTDTFYRGNDGLATGSNWGMRRCNETTNTYANNTTITDDAGFAYALDGTGVDIVIQDSGIEPLHPEWNDKNGNSRLQQIDWGSDDIWGVGNAPFTQSANHYRDYDGHGTHVASTAAGLTYGWAKGAHIYSQKLNGLEGVVGGNDSGTGIPIANAFDAIRLWHLAKTNGRPTVVNMSWGYSTGVSGAPDSGNYRGGAWTYSSETANDLWDTYGLVSDENVDNTGDRSLPVQIASVDAEIEDMLDAGIHICVAAGNDYYKADIPGGADYDNTITFGGTTRFYHRPSSPFADGVFLVGNIESTTFNNGGTYLDRTRGSSKKGPAVNIWAPGTNIKAAMSVINDGGTTYDYPANTSYKIQYLNGTSMSSPQVAGVLALHLQSLPNLSPADLRNRIFSDSASDVIYTTANNDTDYRAFTTSILGAQNRFLYNRYNRQNPWTISRTSTSNVLEIANQTADFSNLPTADGNGFFELTGLDTVFLNDTNYHGAGLIGKSIICEAKVEAYPSLADNSLRWGIRGSNLLSSRNNFEIYYVAGEYHYAEITGARNDITGTGGPVPSLNTVFYYGLHFPDATTLQFSFNGTVCHTETFTSGWLTANGDQRPYFRKYGGTGTFKVKYCATLDTANVADAYAKAQTI